jgi:uncharacterized lipoprotein YajG
MKIKKSLFILWMFSILLSCSNPQKNIKETMIYPITEKKDVIDNYFDIEVKDSYRWL